MPGAGTFFDLNVPVLNFFKITFLLGSDFFLFLFSGCSEERIGIDTMCVFFYYYIFFLTR